MKYGVQQFFVFSPKEWRGVLVFLLVVVALWFWPSSDKDQALVPLSPLPPTALATERFYFDPNALDSMGWVRLGLSPLPLRRLLHYRQKGGRFRQPQDLYRIWDMDSQWVGRVLPWVKLPAAVHAPAWTRVRPPWGDKALPLQHLRSFVAAPLDINGASLSDWEALPGIGPVLAQRIVRFRQSLGGFQGVAQVAQTYGLSETVFRSIAHRLRCDSPSSYQRPRTAAFGQLPPAGSAPNPLAPAERQASDPAAPQPNPAASAGPAPPPSLNQARLADLQALGIAPSLAQAILTYRRLYGPFQALTDLKKIPLVNDSVYQDLVRKLHW